MLVNFSAEAVKLRLLVNKLGRMPEVHGQSGISCREQEHWRYSSKKLSKLG